MNKYCQKCSKQVDNEGQIFCGSCGARVLDRNDVRLRTIYQELTQTEKGIAIIGSIMFIFGLSILIIIPFQSMTSTRDVPARVLVSLLIVIVGGFINWMIYLRVENCRNIFFSFLGRNRNRLIVLSCIIGGLVAFDVAMAIRPSSLEGNQSQNSGNVGSDLLSINGSEIAQRLQAEVGDKYGAPINASCPNERLVVGDSIQCQVTFTDGSYREINVDVQNRGGNIYLEVGLPD